MLLRAELPRGCNMNGVVRKISSGRWDSPIVARLRQFIDLGAADLDALRTLIECELSVERRSDLVVDGYEYSKLSFVKVGFAARYKLLRNGKDFSVKTVAVEVNLDTLQKLNAGQLSPVAIETLKNKLSQASLEMCSGALSTISQLPPQSPLPVEDNP